MTDEEKTILEELEKTIEFLNSKGIELKIYEVLVKIIRRLEK